MRKEDMIIVSVDDHIVEPPDVFAQHLPASYRDRAPQCVQNDKGEFQWMFEGIPTVNFALNAVAGRPREELGFEPNSFDHIRRGCWDFNARIDDMNVNGVLAGVNFPTFPGFSLEMFNHASDKKLGLALIKAYNDWHIDEMCASHPGRFIPLVSVPLWDMKEAVAELKRTVAKGARSISFPSLPTQAGFPNIHNEHWKPLWKAIADEGLPISIHIGTGGGSEHVDLDSPIDSFMTKCGLSAMTVASEWLWSTMLREYSNLKIILSEGGIGWIPYLKERADNVQKNHGPWTHQKWGGKMPSDVFREHFISCFIEDKFGLLAREQIGVETITFENDYPHADITWPNTPEQLEADFKWAKVPDNEIDMITHQNALRVYNWDPFTTLGRENCTVGALRAKAVNVDLTPITGGGKPPADEAGRIVTAADIMKLFPQAKASTEPKHLRA
jgi:predicted TIM-barrel fold metal-dependent hydrolase